MEKGGGGVHVAVNLGVPFLGTISTESKMFKMGDRGRLDILLEKTDLEISRAYGKIIEGMVKA